jgi:hypothetical protein
MLKRKGLLSSYLNQSPLEEFGLTENACKVQKWSFMNHGVLKSYHGRERPERRAGLKSILCDSNLDG